MRFRRGRQEEVSVNVTPLIDVVFLLLIFFMVTTTFSRETQLQIDLPESQSQVAAEDELPIEILIDRTGTYALNDRVLLKQDIGSLKRALAELSDASKTKPRHRTSPLLSRSMPWRSWDLARSASPPRPKPTSLTGPVHMRSDYNEVLV
jgi:biopolymer transport protein ExbD